MPTLREAGDRDCDTQHCDDESVYFVNTAQEAVGASNCSEFSLVREA